MPDPKPMETQEFTPKTAPNGADRLAEARKRKADREAAKQADLDLQELEALDLEEKYIAEGMKEGVDFVIVFTSVGNFAVRKPEFLTGKRFSERAGTDTETIAQFVDPCVMYPDAMTRRTLCQAHGGLYAVLCNALVLLWQGTADRKAGK